VESYPRLLTPSSPRFDPVELARRTEQIVCKGKERKYTAFYCTGVYGGIATGYACGCCLRCVFCWVDWSRDFPEREGKFYTPVEAFDQLSSAARRAGVRKLRVSGAEPTLGRQHLLELLELVEDSPFDLFILETNGILFGSDPRYVETIARFEKLHVRVSLKAGTPHDFARKTGAEPDAFDLPFLAIRRLIDSGVSFHVAAMSGDPRVMSSQERAGLVQRLEAVDPSLVSQIEEEVVDSYKTTLVRLKAAGMDVRWPLSRVYRPLRSVRPRARSSLHVSPSPHGDEAGQEPETCG